MEIGPKSEKLILSFKDINKGDVNLVGGKGSNLGEMYNSGFPVPPGFVVSAYTYKKFIEETGIKAEIEEVMKDLNVDDNEKLQSASKQAQTIIRAEPIPEHIAQAIVRAYEGMYKSQYEIPSQAAAMINAAREPPFIAARSSATAEDLPSASFAGQQATYLNVKGSKDVLEAVRNCWASLFTARAIFYREKNNFDHFKVLIAVVIQKMVDSVKSGVAFSVDPVSENRNKIIIEAGFGLGEAIVSGSINPDHYVVDKNTWEILDKKLMRKDFMIRRSPEGKNVHIQLEEPKSTSQVLTDDEIVELAKIIKMIEDHYEFPQDIEWAVEGQKMFIVQSRPITTLKEEGAAGGPEEKVEMAGEALLTGLPASHGLVSGTVKIVSGIDELGKVEQGDILVTKMTDPDFVPAMKRAAAIVTNEGGTTSHAAIVSREMGIPCIVGTEEATQKLKDDDEITVDATRGKVYMGKVEVEMKKEEAVSGKPEVPIEQIQTKTKIYMNLGIPGMIEKYKGLPIDGIGLMRLEFIIADEVKEHPLKMIKEGRGEEYVNKLAEGISKVAGPLSPRPVVVRMSDFKSNEYSGLAGGDEFEPKEENPMIGWRGVSRYISEDFGPAFRLECKAIKKVRETLPNVWVMLPFVRNINEVKKAIKILQEEGLERDEHFQIWLMAEVPAIAIIPEEFAKLPIDGASIGSNDLTQLTLGVDRDSQILGKMGYFDERNPAVLRSIKRIIKGFEKHGKTVSLCGQAPSVYPEFAEFLVLSGITSISVNPDAVESTKRHVAEVESKLKFLRIAQEEEIE